MDFKISRIVKTNIANIRSSYAALTCRLYYRVVIIGLAVILLLAGQNRASTLDQDSTQNNEIKNKSHSVLPIVMYDSDIGLGTGIKCVFKNYRGHKESFDLLLFGSTRGEQNYAAGLSIPDFECRQGGIYKIAFDFKLEYDKLLKSNYFGIGNDTKNNDRQFPSELFKASMAISHAINSHLIIGAGAKFHHSSVYDYNLAWQTISAATPGAGQNDWTTISLFGRYDTRNSYINPDRGFKAEGTVEQAVKLINRYWDFAKVRFEFSHYHKVLWPKHTLAYRLWLQQIIGDAPYQELSKIGDGWTARGYKAGRFLDKSMVLVSAEYRFPIYKNLGGVTFFDNGRVWPELTGFNLKNWHFNWGIGLRLYLENFVARIDIGHSVEGTRIFFNFSHVF